jgi:hypothetical protein
MLATREAEMAELRRLEEQENRLQDEKVGMRYPRLTVATFLNPFWNTLKMKHSFWKIDRGRGSYVVSLLIF